MEGFQSSVLSSLLAAKGVQEDVLLAALSAARPSLSPSSANNVLSLALMADGMSESGRLRAWALAKDLQIPEVLISMMASQVLCDHPGLGDAEQCEYAGALSPQDARTVVSRWGQQWDGDMAILVDPDPGEIPALCVSARLALVSAGLGGCWPRSPGANRLFSKDELPSLLKFLVEDMASFPTSRLLSAAVWVKEQESSSPPTRVDPDRSRGLVSWLVALASPGPLQLEAGDLAGLPVLVFQAASDRQCAPLALLLSKELGSSSSAWDVFFTAATEDPKACVGEVLARVSDVLA